MPGFGKTHWNFLRLDVPNAAPPLRRHLEHVPKVSNPGGFIQLQNCAITTQLICDVSVGPIRAPGNLMEARTLVGTSGWEIGGKKAIKGFVKVG